MELGRLAVGTRLNSIRIIRHCGGVCIKGKPCLDGKCELLLTDHERLIICFTGNPHPVWIWTPDDVTEEEKAYELIRENGLLTEGHIFNVKYDCPNPIEPHVRICSQGKSVYDRLIKICRRR